MGVKPANFAKLMCISRQCLNGWMSRPVTKNTALIINRQLPYVSIPWLMTGEGEMFNRKPSHTIGIDILLERIRFLEKENARLLAIIEKSSLSPRPIR